MPKINYKKFASRLISAAELRRRGLPVQIRQKGVKYDPFVDEKELHALKIRQQRAVSGREKIAKVNADPEFRKRSLERLKKLNSDPKFIKSRAKQLKQLHSNPEIIKQNVDRFNKLNSDPAFKQASRERMIAMNKARSKKKS